MFVSVPSRGLTRATSRYSASVFGKDGSAGPFHYAGRVCPSGPRRLNFSVLTQRPVYKRVYVENIGSSAKSVYTLYSSSVGGRRLPQDLQHPRDMDDGGDCR